MLGLTGFLRQLTNTRAMDVAVVDGNGDQITSFGSGSSTPPPNAVLTNVTVSTTSAVLLAANVNRRRFIIYNDSGRHVFVAFAATASSTSFTVDLPNNGFYEGELHDYTGVISGVTQSGTGPVRVTEITT